MLVDESNFESFDKAHKLTLVDYNIRWTDPQDIKGYIDPNVMLNMIDDLICETEYWKEKYNDLLNEVQNHYERIKEPDPDYER